MIDARALAADARSLPQLSKAVQAVLRLLRAESSSADAIEQAMLRDAALTANVLRAANSPLFGLSRLVRSPGHAVTLLGRSRVRDLVVTAGLQAVIPRELAGYRIDASTFLIHSIVVGYLSERIAARCLPGREASWFVAGLLHDIGKLVLSRHLAEREPDLLSQLEQGVTLVSAERALFGTDHTEVAAVIGESWQLPADLMAAAIGHHDPNIVVGEGVPLADVVHVANAAAHIIGYGEDIGGLARAVDPCAFRRLELRASTIERIASESLDVLLEVCRSVTSQEHPK